MPYDVFLPEFFKKIIKELKKKYPHVGEDLKTALRVLVNNPELGRTLRGFGDVKKLRVQNSDVERGKSGGYRLDLSRRRYLPEDHSAANVQQITKERHLQERVENTLGRPR